MTTHATRSLLAGFALAAAAMPGLSQAPAPAAPVTVQGAWIRTAVQGQRATGGFLTLTAQENLQLVGASSPAAGHAEVHEMKMDGGVMRMREVPAIDLPAGRPVELKPGGYHLMLMELKAPLAQGGKVPLTLTFKDSKGALRKLDLTVPVAATKP